MKRALIALSLCFISRLAYGQSPDPDSDKPKISFGIDASFAGVHDNAERGSMGRERQTKIAFFNFAVKGELTDRISFNLTINPANDGRVPRPYVPRSGDRSNYFFPNMPEGRGVVSDPEGLYKVDDYKNTGLDPIIQQGLMRVGYVDIHSKNKDRGIMLGRNYVPQGLMLDDFHWFTAKDMTHIQLINTQADNGAFMYLKRGHVSFHLDLISGNGNPYHDYGYYDFTDASEDKNSFMGGIVGGRFTASKFIAGTSFKKNVVNSRIEDSITLQLSKHNDDSFIIFGSVTPNRYVRIFGEHARYTWGLAKTSAQLLKGPEVESPVIKSGYYYGFDLNGPDTKFGKWGFTYTREKLSRDDSLVAWAAANHAFDAALGANERSNIFKIYGQFGKYLTGFFFFNQLSVPFPELSALRPLIGRVDQSSHPPIFGQSSGISVNQRKIGLGIRLSM